MRGIKLQPRIITSTAGPPQMNSHLAGLVEDVGQVTAATVLAVVHGSHENTSATGVTRALATQTLDLAVAVDLVILKHSELVLLALVLDLLRGGVDLLLPLLTTTTQTQHQVQGALLLDVVVGESTAILELFAGEDQPLLVRGNTLLVLDLGLDIVDGVGRLHLEGDSLPREGLDEDLHDCLLDGGARLGDSSEVRLDLCLEMGRMKLGSDSDRKA